MEEKTNKEKEIFVIDETKRLRDWRCNECFSIINRGQLWYDTLNDAQLAELKIWYRAWLSVTETNKIPQKPKWLDAQIATEQYYEII